jgi:hypothetical protein
MSYNVFPFRCRCMYLQSTRIVPAGVVETSQIFLRDTHLNVLALRNTVDVTGGEPMPVRVPSTSEFASSNTTRTKFAFDACFV